MKRSESEVSHAGDRGVIIRRATRDDAGGILSCLHAAFEPYRQSYTPEAFEDTVLTSETLRDRLHDMTVFVAVANDKDIVGTVACKTIFPNEGHLRGMAVLPPWRGRGVAEQLLIRAERELRLSGCGRVSLDTTEPLERAIRFYEKHGYRRSGEIADFFGMPLYEYVRELEAG